jgi:4-diphosphocytidyl-2-C-methyl-D-erythritol kinase
MHHNDLEAAAFHINPALRSLKKQLCSLGAEGVAMTGSGAAIFGVWRMWDDARAAAERLRVAGVWARVVRVLETIPAVELVAER